MSIGIRYSRQTCTWQRLSRSSWPMLKIDFRRSSLHCLGFLPWFLLRCSEPLRNEIGVAPGLSVSVDIEFLTRKADDYSDTLVVVAEDQPLRCVKGFHGGSMIPVARVLSHQGQILKLHQIPMFSLVQSHISHCLEKWWSMDGHLCRHFLAIWGDEIQAVSPPSCSFPIDWETHLASVI